MTGKRGVHSIEKVNAHTSSTIHANKLVVGLKPYLSDSVSRLRDILLSTVAASALWIAAPGVASAGPLPCVTVGEVVTCLGDQSAGITNQGGTPDFVAPPVTTLNVNNLTQSIMPAGGVDGIEFEVPSGNNINITSDTGAFGITTTGSGDGIDASVNGSGNVTITSTGSIDAGRIGIVADVTNGDINVISTGNITSLTDNGFRLGSDSGNITVTSIGDIDVDEEGIDASVGSSGAGGSGNITITSTGNITSQTEEGIGASVGGGGAGGSGNVTVTSTGNINADEYGIEASVGGGGAGGSGNVTVTSTGNITSQTSDGIEATVGAGGGGGNGNVTVRSTGNINVDEDGIDAYVGGDGDINVTSSGNITSLTENGILGDIIGNGNITITSTGNITANALNHSGVEVSTGTGSSTVNLMGGTIQGGTGTGVGVNFTGGAGTTNTLNNSATIRALSGTAIRGVAGDETVNLLPGSVVIGQIDLGGGTNTLGVANGLNIVYTFIGAPPDNINTNGAPVVVSGNTVAVLDTTTISQQDEMLADLTSGIFNSIHARFSSGDSNNTEGQTQKKFKSGIWTQAFGGFRDADADRPAAGSDYAHAGVMAGIDGRAMPGIHIGGFGGYAKADLETVTDSQNIESDSYFGGIYANLQSGDWFARLILTAGHSDHDSQRTVLNNLVSNGFQTASASFDGTFISPEATLGTTMEFGGITIEPSARLRYANISLDGYSETGAATNIAINGRDVSLWLGRAQIAFPLSVPNGTISPRIGVEARESDNDSASGRLLGQAISFNPGGENDEVTGFLGLSFAAEFMDGMSAFGDSELHVGDDGIARAEARMGVKVTF